jgi:hypothetical protein
MKIRPTMIVGGILWIAAALKLFDPQPSAALWEGQQFPSWATSLLIQAEFLLGALLLFGWLPRLGWATAMILFGVFAVYSFGHAISGYRNCSCFGPIKTSPWFSFILDSGITCLLIVYRRAFLERPTPSPARVLGGIVGYALFGGAAALLIPGATSTALSHGVSQLDGSGIVVLQPHDWIGREFPLQDAITTRVDLSTGEWTLFFFHHDCSKCQKALPLYEQLAKRIDNRKKRARVLMVEVPPFAVAEENLQSADRTQLSADREWFVQTPVEIQVRDGTVTLASPDLPSVANFR